MKKVQVGLVGCGRISQFHLDALKELSSEFELVGVADSNFARAQEAAKKYGCAAHKTLEDLLLTPKLQCVAICTPSGLHPEHAKKCLEFGVGCLSEKPFGCYYRDSLKVVEEFEKQNLPLFVVSQNRFNPTVMKVRHWLEAGHFGKIFFIQANVFWTRPQDYYDAEPWRGTRELDGGVFLNQANHYIDLVQWFGGDVISVKSEISTMGRKIECEDVGVASLKFRNGALGVVSATTLTYPENLEGSLTILAENATVRIGGKALNKLEVCNIKDLEKHKEELDYEPVSVYGNGHKEYYRRLYEYMTTGKNNGLVDGREALKSVRITEQIYRVMDDTK